MRDPFLVKTGRTNQNHFGSQTVRRAKSSSHQKAGGPAPGSDVHSRRHAEGHWAQSQVKYKPLAPSPSLVTGRQQQDSRTWKWTVSTLVSSVLLYKTSSVHARSKVRNQKHKATCTNQPFRLSAPSPFVLSVLCKWIRHFPLCWLAQCQDLEPAVTEDTGTELACRRQGAQFSQL